MEKKDFEYYLKKFVRVKLKTSGFSFVGYLFESSNSAIKILDRKTKKPASFDINSVEHISEVNNEGN